MNAHPHEVQGMHEVQSSKMNTHPHEVQVLHEVQGVKMNAHPHEVQVLHEVPVLPQPHLIEVHIQPQPPPQPLSEVHVDLTNIPLENHQPPPEEPKKRGDKKKKEAIDGQAREVIFKVIKFFESEKQNRGYAFPVENVVKRACAATGLSESTIKRIKRDGLRAEATQTRMTGPKKKRVRKTKVQLDYFQLCALRGIVNSYSVRKEVPTLGKILTAAKHELNYTGGKESLRLILLNKLGIKFKKCEKKVKKPPEQAPPQPMQQMQNVMQQPPPQMQHVKTMENQFVYTNMIPPVSY